ncbi:MAG: hypothetical protein HQK77_10760 [Desulfobacterales bacterium]|nr:hypothetical protein [Desulfobacterales bacterium]
MAFSDYKHISQVQQDFQITYFEESFIRVSDIETPAAFLAEFTFNKDYFDLYTSEASRSELIILPVLREVYKTYASQYALWIQKTLTYDQKLSGTPDYLIATRSILGKTVLEKPLLIAVEAKKNDFEQGWGQCAAELVAAQKLNDNSNLPVYGIVTDGRFWEFGKLVKNQFIQNSEAYSVDQLNLLFGALHFLFQCISKERVNSIVFQNSK